MGTKSASTKDVFISYKRFYMYGWESNGVLKAVFTIMPLMSCVNVHAVFMINARLAYRNFLIDGYNAHALLANIDTLFFAIINEIKEIIIGETKNNQNQ